MSTSPWYQSHCLTFFLPPGLSLKMLLPQPDSAVLQSLGEGGWKDSWQGNSEDAIFNCSCLATVPHIFVLGFPTWEKWLAGPRVATALLEKAEAKEASRKRSIHWTLSSWPCSHQTLHKYWMGLVPECVCETGDSSPPFLLC